MAIFYALASPELDVVGHHIGVRQRPHLGVHRQRAEVAGDRRPRRHPRRQGRRSSTGNAVSAARWRSSTVPTAKATCSCRRPRRSRYPIDAAHFIIRSVMDAPGEITLVALGPLTNVAMALMLEPTLGFSAGSDRVDGRQRLLRWQRVSGCGGQHPQRSRGGRHRLRRRLPDRDGRARRDREGRHDRRPTSPHSRRSTTPERNTSPRSSRSTSGSTAQRLGLDGIFVHDSTTISYLLSPQSFAWVEHPDPRRLRPQRLSRQDPAGHARQRPRVGLERTAGSANPHRGRQPRRG